MKKIYIYTDGGCSGNQFDENIGGYGAILQYGQHKKEIYGGEKNTTNNRMELTAVIEALKLVTDLQVSIEIYSDSSYVVECFVKKWYVNWEKNGWKNAKKVAVENQDLWLQLLSLVRQFEAIQFYRIKGHLNIEKTADINKWYKKFITQRECTLDDFKYLVGMNNRADELANIAMAEIK